MRFWFSGPRIMGIRPGISLTDGEMASVFLKHPLLRMNDAQNALAVADAYAKIDRLSPASREKARLAVDAAVAYREQLKAKERRDNRTIGVTFVTFAVIAALLVVMVFGPTEPPSIGAMAAVVIAFLIARRLNKPRA
jgi:TRAP-type C4-dicarboxylate transport system permease large subunit